MRVSVKKRRGKVTPVGVSSYDHMARSLSPRELTAAASLIAFATACGAEDSSSPTGIGAWDGGAPDSGLDAGMCMPQSCACPNGTGLQSCEANGKLSACQCPSLADPLDAAVVIVGICPTGRYAGNFKGTAGFIIPTADITGLDFFNNQPPLQITLSPPKGGSEFTVSGDGVMRGNANGTFPFEATIKGDLDCNTKQFKATLSGSVQLFLEGIRNDFTGSMESSYDTDAQAFTAGTWKVMGNGSDGGTDFGLTANGTWMAMHAEDAGTP